MGNTICYSKVSDVTLSLENSEDNNNGNNKNDNNEYNDDDSDGGDSDNNEYKKINDSLFLSVMQNSPYVSLKILEYLEKNICPENFNRIINYTNFNFNIEKSSILLYASENKMELLLN